MKHELIKDKETIYVGCLSECIIARNKIEYSCRYDNSRPVLELKAQLEEGSEQSYINDVLYKDGFMYGM